MDKNANHLREDTGKKAENLYQQISKYAEQLGYPTDVFEDTTYKTTVIAMLQHVFVEEHVIGTAEGVDAGGRHMAHAAGFPYGIKGD